MRLPSKACCTLNPCFVWSFAALNSSAPSISCAPQPSIPFFPPTFICAFPSRLNSFLAQFDIVGEVHFFEHKISPTCCHGGPTGDAFFKLRLHPSISQCEITPERFARQINNWRSVARPFVLRNLLDATFGKPVDQFVRRDFQCRGDGEDVTCQAVMYHDVDALALGGHFFSLLYRHRYASRKLARNMVHISVPKPVKKKFTPMDKEHQAFLNLLRLPGSIAPEEVAVLLGVSVESVTILVKCSFLVPLGRPLAPNAPRRFASVEIEGLTRDVERMNRMHQVLTKYWRTRNGTRRRSGSCFKQSQTVRVS